jgi:hypothetical protein
MEQLSNARALEQLGLGEVVHSFDRTRLQAWLAKARPQPRAYPNVAAAVVDWIRDGMTEDESSLSRRLWAGYA